MDHHDDWEHWGEEPADFADADTADLGEHDLTDVGHLDAHDTLDPTGAPDGEDGGHLVEPGPDLLHDGDGDLGLDPPHDDAAAHETLGAEPGDGYEPDQPAFTDPDLPDHDPGGYDGDFPPPLDLGHAPPDPVDGYPWSDPAALGDPAEVTGAAGGPAGLDEQFGFAAAAHPDDLFAYSGMQPAGADAWSALLGADDPATSTLARWWAPS
jgi:hypothetical protein